LHKLHGWQSFDFRSFRSVDRICTNSIDDKALILEVLEVLVEIPTYFKGAKL